MAKKSCFPSEKICGSEIVDPIGSSSGSWLEKTLPRDL